MYYNSRYSSAISKLVDDVFAYPFPGYSMTIQTDNVYDSFATNKDGSTVISVVVPGFAKEDLELTANNGQLTLKSKLKDKKLSRFWDLSETADVQNISAECKNGILNITVPILSKKEKPRTVEIK
jgi:HSP20 family molecular chaperone IbpA